MQEKTKKEPLKIKLVRISNDVHELLKIQCAEEHVSMSSFVSKHIADFLKNQKTNPL
jgi:predicted HicB family RNase H-like nuclease